MVKQMCMHAEHGSPQPSGGMYGVGHTYPQQPACMLAHMWPLPMSRA
jgi:hypothetical protein